MRLCKICGEKIEDEFNECSYCGEVYKDFSTYKFHMRWFFFAFAFVIVGPFSFPFFLANPRYEKKTKIKTILILSLLWFSFAFFILIVYNKKLKGV